jgi:hypothetical protein
MTDSFELHRFVDAQAPVFAAPCWCQAPPRLMDSRGSLNSVLRSERLARDGKPINDAEREDRGCKRQDVQRVCLGEIENDDLSADGEQRNHDDRADLDDGVAAFMSGGTLIALAADEIVMCEHSVLGTIDPQLGELPAASLIKVVEEKLDVAQEPASDHHRHHGPDTARGARTRPAVSTG